MFPSITGAFIGYYCTNFYIKNTDVNNDKILFFIRKDLKMGKGKIAAQCGHASLKLYRKNYKNGNHDFCSHFIEKGYDKIFYYVHDEEQKSTVFKIATANNIPYIEIHDAGRTQIKCGSQTVSAIGPVSEHQLKLFDMFEVLKK